MAGCPHLVLTDIGDNDGLIFCFRAYRFQDTRRIGILLVTLNARAALAVLSLPTTYFIDPCTMITLFDYLVSRARASLASATIGTAARFTLCISEGSISIWMKRACGANSLALPVTRSSKRNPTPIIRSDSPMARLTCAGPCIPGIPKAKGCVSGKALRPSSVVITGILVFSANACSSA